MLGFVLLPQRSRSLIVLVAIGLTACGRGSLQVGPPVSFHDLCILQPAQFGSLTGDQVAQWINDTYHVKPQLTHRMNGADQSSIYAWVLGPTIRSAEIRNDRLLKFTQTELQKGPTLQQVVAGLGIPDFVYGTGRVFEGVEYQIMLQYPTQGVRVGRIAFKATEEIRSNNRMELHLTPDIQVNYIDCFAPASSVEDMLRQVYDFPSDSIADYMRLSIPWPGFGAWVPLNSLNH